MPRLVISFLIAFLTISVFSCKKDSTEEIGWDPPSLRLTIDSVQQEDVPWEYSSYDTYTYSSRYDFKNDSYRVKMFFGDDYWLHFTLRDFVNGEFYVGSHYNNLMSYDSEPRPVDCSDNDLATVTGSEYNEYGEYTRFTGDLVKWDDCDVTITIDAEILD